MPDWSIHDPVLQFTVVVVIALVVRVAIESAHLPGIIGLLVAGAVIGPNGTELLPRGDVIQLLGQVGLIYLMFIAGLEINLDIFTSHKRETGAFGMSAFLLSFLPAVGLGFWLGFDWNAALLLGTLLSSHTLLAYPIVHQLGLQGRTSSVAAIGGTLITDTLALVLLAVAIQTTNDESGLWTIARPLVLLAMLTAASLWLVPRAARQVLKKKQLRRAEKALFVLVVLLVLAAASELNGTHTILGGFLAGICLNRVLNNHREMQEHMEFLGRLMFIPFFFIDTGMRLDAAVLTGGGRVWLIAGGLFAVVIFGKLSASWLCGWWFEYSRNDRLMMTGLTLPQAAATLAVTVTAREAGLFSKEVLDAVILLIFATCLAGPLLTKYAGRKVVEESHDATRHSHRQPKEDYGER